MGRRFDESRADPLAPKIGLDEQAVELIFDDGGEARHPTIELGDDHLAALDLISGQVDGVGMGGELLAIVGKRQRRAALEILQLLSLTGLRQADSKRLSAL